MAGVAHPWAPLTFRAGHRKHLFLTISLRGRACGLFRDSPGTRPGRTGQRVKRLRGSCGAAREAEHMTDQRAVDERLYPAKLVAAIVSTAVMWALFAVAVVRGPNDFYVFLVGGVAVALTVAVPVYAVRHHRRVRRGVR
jgi:hypothetical protein